MSPFLPNKYRGPVSIMTNPALEIDYKESRFVWPLRIYYGDTDAAGVVYYANYLRLCEIGRTEWLRAMGIDQTTFKQQTGLVFVVRSLTADYYASAMLDDELELVTTIENVRHAKATFRQVVMRGEERLFEAGIIIVCVDWHKKKASPFPPEIRKLFERLAAV